MSGKTILFAFAGGALVGAVAGLLLAPQSGEETRRELRGYARKAEEEILQEAREARAALDEAIDRGKRLFQTTKEVAAEVVEAGHDAFRSAVAK